MVINLVVLSVLKHLALNRQTLQRDKVLIVSDGVASRESHSIIRAVLIHTKQISPRWHVKERKNG